MVVVLQISPRGALRMHGATGCKRDTAGNGGMGFSHKGEHDAEVVEQTVGVAIGSAAALAMPASDPYDPVSIEREFAAKSNEWPVIVCDE
jgi:hypothetical protein